MWLGASAPSLGWRFGRRLMAPIRRNVEPRLAPRFIYKKIYFSQHFFSRHVLFI